MDFIERMFHIAPDSGNGLTEIGIVLAVVFVLLGVYLFRRAKRVVRDRPDLAATSRKADKNEPSASPSSR